MPKAVPANPAAAADAGTPAGCAAHGCPQVKSISGRFDEAEVKCGDPAHVSADGVNISEAASTSFAIARVRDSKALTSVSGPMAAQHVRTLAWKPQRPADYQPGELYQFDVSADGVSAKSANQFKFKDYPDYAAETKTFNCVSGVFAWTGKFDIKFAADVITVTVKVKLLNRQGPKPAGAANPLPAIGDAVSADDKAAMKADIEGKISQKVNLLRASCGFGAACSCAKPIKVLVDFVESAQHHEVNLFQGAGRANASNWTRVKTRDNSWAHETGHLLGWYDEYTGGAVGSAPRWKPNDAANIMNVGLTMPPEYAWDFRDWFAAKTGETWTAK